MKKWSILLLSMIIILVTLLFIFLQIGQKQKISNNNLETMENIEIPNIIITKNNEQLKEEKRITITDKNKVNELLELIKGCEQYDGEKIKLHINGIYNIQIGNEIVILFDNLDNEYVKYTSNKINNIIPVPNDFKQKIVNYIL